MSNEARKQEELEQKLATLKKQYDHEVMNSELKLLDCLHNEFKRYASLNKLPVRHATGQDFYIKRYDYRAKGKISTIQGGAFNCRLMSLTRRTNRVFIKVRSDLWIVDVFDKFERTYMTTVVPQSINKFSNKSKMIENDISQILIKIKRNRTKEKIFKYYCENVNGIGLKYPQKEEENFNHILYNIFKNYE